MTAPRAKIEASLAERGRPAMWANEQEAAILSGYSADGFRANLKALERAGFPQVNRWNGKRYIPAIKAFWDAQVDSGTLGARDSDEDESRVENFGGQTQRRAS